MSGDDRTFPQLPSAVMETVRGRLPARLVEVELESLCALGAGLDEFSLTLPYPLASAPAAPDGMRLAEAKMSLLDASASGIRGVRFTLLPAPGQRQFPRWEEFPFPEPVAMGEIGKLADAVLGGQWDRVPVPHASDAPSWGENDLPRWRSDAFDRLTAHYDLDNYDANRDFYVSFDEVTYYEVDGDVRDDRRSIASGEPDVSLWSTVPLSLEILSSAAKAAGAAMLENGSANLVFVAAEQSSPFADKSLAFPGSLGGLECVATSLDGTDAFERWSNHRWHMTEDFEVAWEHGFLDDEPADKLPLDGERWYRAVGNEEGSNGR